MTPGRRLILASPIFGDTPHVLAFPTEDGRGLALEPRDTQALLERPSTYYAALSRSIAERMAGELEVGHAAASVLARDPTVLLTYLFLDRAVRVLRLVQREGVDTLAVPDVRDDPADRLEWLRVRSSTSAVFNQMVLSRAAEAWGLPRVDFSGEFPAEPASPKKAALNNNFTAPSVARRVQWKLCRLLSRRWGRIPTSGLSYSTENFLNGFMFWPGRLADLGGVFPPLRPVDAALRRRVLAAAIEACAPEWRALLESFGASAEVSERSVPIWRDFVVLHYPTTLLEDAPANLATASAELRPFRRSALLFSETGDTRSQTMLAAAREAGLRVVGFQHGAHYGFAPHAVFVEQEFAHCDAFVGWGWTELPNHPLTRNVKTISMPAPWLSDRGRRWRSLLTRPSTKRWDVLLMTDKFFKFPPTLYTNRAGRMDFLADYCRNLEQVVRALTGEGLTVLHHPFDRMSAAVQAGTLARLERELDGRYVLDGCFDKGLTAELIGKAKLTVWDEPGTGWFECLIAGVPSLLMWPRLPVAEEPYARPLFDSVERVGVSHHKAESLAAEAARCAADPRAWLSRPDRAAAVGALCRRYAWTQDDWPKPWARFVKELAGTS